jgi:sulfatase modifying factor 1
MKKAKALLSTAAIASLLIIAGCSGGYNGQLLGELDRPKWNPITPYGMVLFHREYCISVLATRMLMLLQARAKQVSIVGFYMDDTEITNNEYRQFINYVRDSVAHKMLEHVQTSEEGKTIDWNKKIEWSGKEKNEQLEEIYLAENERVWGRKELDLRKLKYDYEWFDYKAASLTKTEVKSRTSFIRKESCDVYPDTLVWVRDFSYSYNEPMTRNYFHHPCI